MTDTDFLPPGKLIIWIILPYFRESGTTFKFTEEKASTENDKTPTKFYSKSLEVSRLYRQFMNNSRYFGHKGIKSKNNENKLSPQFDAKKLLFYGAVFQAD